MTAWYERLHEMPLRTKVFLTLAGTAVAVVGIAGFFSFRYWEDQAISAAREQALLAAESSRAAVESALAFGRTDQARRNLERLTRQGSILQARVYGPDGRIVLSGNEAEEGVGHGLGGVWIPDPTEIPDDGVARESPDGESVRAFLPLSTPSANVFEVVFSVAPVEQAMETGTRLSLGLAVGSVLALGVILFTMLRQEVMGPMDRIQEMLAGSGVEAEAEDGRGRAEIQRMERSVARLIEMEERAEELAEQRGRELEEKEGFAEVGQFASEMAHELKKPLSNIQTAMQLLEQEYELESGGGELLDAVEGQLDRLSDTMGDLFSLARPVEVERTSTKLAGVLDSALAQVRSLPEADGIEIRTDYDPDTPSVLADERKLEQAFLNLMTNAAEAMGEGGVLTVRCRPSGDGGAEVVVEDTGAGIPPEEVAEVTRPFYSTKPMGTGLGLPLVARIARAHGAELGIRSEPGEGTRVRIGFPSEEEASRTTPPPREEAGRPEAPDREASSAEHEPGPENAGEGGTPPGEPTRREPSSRMAGAGDDDPARDPERSGP